MTLLAYSAVANINALLILDEPLECRNGVITQEINALTEAGNLVLCLLEPRLELLLGRLQVLYVSGGTIQ
jgi:hypothetical protein